MEHEHKWSSAFKGFISGKLHEEVFSCNDPIHGIKRAWKTTYYEKPIEKDLEYDKSVGHEIEIKIGGESPTDNNKPLMGELNRRNQTAKYNTLAGGKIVIDKSTNKVVKREI